MKIWTYETASNNVNTETQQIKLANFLVKELTRDSIQHLILRQFLNFPFFVSLTIDVFSIQ